MRCALHLYRYPVILRRFELRPGSGGRGRFRGGDGVVRELVFREEALLSVLTERRAFQPYGLHGGWLPQLFPASLALLPPPQDPISLPLPLLTPRLLVFSSYRGRAWCTWLKPSDQKRWAHSEFGRQDIRDRVPRGKRGRSPWDKQGDKNLIWLPNRNRVVE